MRLYQTPAIVEVVSKPAVERKMCDIVVSEIAINNLSEQMQHINNIHLHSYYSVST